MNHSDEISAHPDQAVAELKATDSGERTYPGTVAWLRQLTLWQIIAQPWLPLCHPRLFLEKPWLLVLLFGGTGVLTGGIGGSQQGLGSGVGKMIEGAVVCGFVAGVVGAGILSPVAIGLWVAREVGRWRSAARRARQATNDSRVTASSSAGEMIQFVYRPNRFLVVALFLLCVTGEGVFCYFAFANRDALASVIAVVGSVGVIALGAMVVSAFLQERRVVFTQDGLILPKPHWTGLSSDEIQIAYGDIVDLQFVPAGLVLNHRQRKFFLVKQMFPSRHDFDRATALLVEAVARCRQKQVLGSVTDLGCSDAAADARQHGELLH